MKKAANPIPPDCVVPSDAVIEPGAEIGTRVVLAGPDIIIHSYPNASRLGRIPLGVSDSELFLMRRVSDARGALTVGNFLRNFPLPPPAILQSLICPCRSCEHAHKECQQFLICLHGSEAEWADWCGAGHAVGVASGLDALILALRALEIGPGDEVIVPSNTYIATWLAVTAVGARPVPVEPDPATHNIGPARIAAAVTPATRAILPVRLYGQPADLDPILTLARPRHRGG